jgi:hypothetical protein
VIENIGTLQNVRPPIQWVKLGALKDVIPGGLQIQGGGQEQAKDRINRYDYELLASCGHFAAGIASTSEIWVGRG